MREARPFPLRPARARRRLIALALAAIAGCAGADEVAPAPGAPEAVGAAGAGDPALRDRGARPPIPADEPAWRGLKEGFVPVPHFYGEARWDDVEMRVLGQQAAALRDLARLSAAADDLQGAAALYDALAARLEAASLGEEGVSREIRALLLAAAQRDAALCRALAGAGPPPAAAGPVADLRAALLTGAPGAEVAAAADAILAEPPWGGLDLSGFEDFEARHRLRVELYRYALDASDPLSITPWWGYWTPAAAEAQVRAIRVASAAEGFAARRAAFAEAIGAEIAAAQPAGFVATSLGALPTGDTYIDTAGEPGPVAIGVLERLDASEPEHRAWLEAQADALNAAMRGGDPVAALEQTVAALEAHAHGSRFYNVKAAKNEGVRQLARAGRLEEARAVLRWSWPLRAQDFACPNRDGILLGIEGRLMGLAGDPGAVEALEASLAAGDVWLRRVAEAEARGPSGPPHPPPG